MDKTRTKTEGRPRVAIIGAGFGGLWAARNLAGKPLDVILVDRNNYHAFLPLLYQVAAAEIEATEISFPVRSIFRRAGNVEFLMGEVQNLDLEGRTIYTEQCVVAYDYLILALGSDTNYYGVPGAKNFAFPLKTVREAIDLRSHILTRFEMAAHEPLPDRRKRLLTFVIVGGGATGVEFSGALAELVYRPLKKDYPSLDFSEVSILLLEATDRLLGSFPERLGQYASKRLSAMGVNVCLRSAVTRVTPRSLHLKGGEVIDTETVVWTAGVTGNPKSGKWGLPLAQTGRVRVHPTLQVPGRPELYVIGDLAHVEEDGNPLPLLAPVAIRQGEWAARNILLQARGQNPRPFQSKDPGVLATIGRNAGVAHVWGWTFTGFLAWVLWIGVHIIKLIGFRNRIFVLLNWSWDYFRFERAVRLILAPPPGRDASRSRKTC